jgi:hypothetical protein
VLHIGLPKTGTTSIQRMLGTQRGALRERGYYYPSPTEGAVPQFLHKVHRGAGAGAFWRSLTEEMAGLPQHDGTVILSGEQCSLSLRDESDVAALHARLADHFTSMRVVVYLRRQDLHAASLFAQALRLGRVAPPDLASFGTEMAPVHDFEALLGRWAAVFGEAALVPRIYARDCLPDGDVVRDFLQVCGLDATWAAQHAAAHNNPSMNLAGQSFLLGIGGWLQAQSGGGAIDGGTWAGLAALATRGCPGRGWRPFQAEAASYLAGFAASNEAVRRRWFPGRDSLFDMSMSELPVAAELPTVPPDPETAYAIIMELVRGMQDTKKGTVSTKAEENRQRRVMRAERRARKAGGFAPSTPTGEPPRAL